MLGQRLHYNDLKNPWSLGTRMAIPGDPWPAGDSGYDITNHYVTRVPFLETSDNFPGPKTILGAQYSRISYTIFIDFER